MLFLRPIMEHVTAIKEAPPPKDATALHSFLGLTGWYAKFIPCYASVVEPLRALLRGGSEFKWTDELIATSPALTLFDPTLPTLVTTDACDYGIGAVLTQMHGDTEKTVAFASRALTSTERNYSIIEKEALACVWAAERWRTYLWGRHFTLRTDHSPYSPCYHSPSAPNTTHATGPRYSPRDSEDQTEAQEAVLVAQYGL
uniref:Reverse transcriptase/retrotransposon-derived protein RNase H-like domain-containing protein n=1 Tax=Salarias fasciatus TaxID=181472 RepID=A0A672GRZ7_SALFA